MQEGSSGAIPNKQGGVAQLVKHLFAPLILKVLKTVFKSIIPFTSTISMDPIRPGLLKY